MPSATVLDQPSSALCDDYKDRRLPVHWNAKYERVCLNAAGGCIAGLHMQEKLGARVHEEMRIRMRAGAVYARPPLKNAPPRWTFLAEVDRWPAEHAADELTRAGASLTSRTGTELPLPPSLTAVVAGEPWWILPPGAALPDLSILVAVTRIVAGRGW
jgi:hypothetical protein